jgi:hypothetical protein
VFQAQHEALTVSDVLRILLFLPPLPDAFALEMGAFFLDFASCTASHGEQLPVVAILDRLLVILCDVRHGDAIKTLSQTARELIATQHCPPIVVVGHDVHAQLWAQLEEPAVREKPRNWAQFVSLVLDIAKAINREARLDMLRAISLERYAFLRLECSTKTATVALSLLTLLLAVDDTCLEAFYDNARVLHETWEISQCRLSHALAVPWLAFCHALIFRIGALAVFLFLEQSVITTTWNEVDDDDLQSRPDRDPPSKVLLFY